MTVTEAYSAPLGSHPERPWVGLCMVTSIDGSTVVDGASAGLSSDTDSAILLRLRAVADVIVVGAGTVRDEGYGAPKKPGQRIGVVTRSGSVDPNSELFRSGAGFLITTTRAELDEGVGSDAIRAGTDDVDLRAAFERIPSLCPGARFIQVEGGPSLNAAIASTDLLDELNLTTSPMAVGGDGPRLLHGASRLEQRYELVQLAIDDQSFVFSRWLRRAEPTSP
jgi:riboflavin biosynthesis pyrimidine reductase